jgi:ABC-type sugar transport system ATPase subunit
LATHSFNEAYAAGDSVVVLQGGRLAGYRALRDSSVEELRSFYFQATGELDEARELTPRSWQ